MKDEQAPSPPPKRRRRFRPDEKAEWVRRFLEAGLTQHEFCRAHPISLSTLQRWVAEHESGSQSASQSSQAVFAEVPCAAPSLSTWWVAELCRPNGSVLRLAQEVSPGLLEKLLRLC
jgi:transposase-like protein